MEFYGKNRSRKLLMEVWKVMVWKLVVAKKTWRQIQIVSKINFQL